MKLRVKLSEAKPDPQPIESNASLAVLLGTLAWLLALISILLLDQTLPEPLPDWWALTCIFGICLGIFGFFKVRNR
ncbi:MAG: DUF2530 domain-containing protein [Actinobacteria bacterium]|nr:DUF2530 domain-containing protein [Actinomycetota bacterium]